MWIQRQVAVVEDKLEMKGTNGSNCRSGVRFSVK